jgi:hypothetical protein
MSPKTLTLVVAMSSILSILAGCASPTVVHKRDGSTVVTPERPKFNKNTGFYEYKDSGRMIRLNKDDVTSIEDIEN